MSNQTKQNILQKYQKFLQNAISETENRDIIMRNYDQMVLQVLDSKNLEQLEIFENEYLLKIQNKQFISIDFEFNNLILGRPKAFYTQTNFQTEYKKYYIPNISLSEIWDNLTNDQIKNFPPINFCEKVRYLSAFFKKEEDLELEHIIENISQERILIEISGIRNSAIENLLHQIFLMFLISTADFPAILRDYLIDLFKLLEFFTASKKLSSENTKNLRFVFCKILEGTIQKQPFIPFLIDTVNNYFGCLEIIRELSLFLSLIILFVFENTKYNFLSKVVFNQKSSPEFFKMSQKQLLTLKNEIMRVLKAMNCYDMSHKAISGITNTLFFLFNVKKSAVIVFDESLTQKTAKRKMDQHTTVLIANESRSIHNFLVLNDVFSETGSKFFSSFSNSEKGDENYTEGFFKRRRKIKFCRKLFK